jgi:hypothetical protein
VGGGFVLGSLVLYAVLYIAGISDYIGIPITMGLAALGIGAVFCLFWRVVVGRKEVLKARE